jgi:TonB family protein
LTAPDSRFGIVMAGSLLAHSLLLGVLMLLPAGGGPSQTIPIYTVKIVEAPQIPEARVLDLSPALRRELHLEAPSLTPDAPPLPTAPAPDVTGLEAPAPPSPTAALSPAPTAPSLAAPRPGTAPAQQPSTELVLPAPPALPQPPAPRVARRPPGAAPSAPPGAPGRTSAASPPPPPDAPSLEERLRSKVQSLNLQVESAEPAPGARPEAPAEQREQSLISLRLFQNTVRERVKKNYTFPGSFPEDLRARVRVVLERSGKLKTAELVESSGNDRFDKLVCLAAIRNAKYPPVPESVEGDPHTLYLTCSP